MSQLKHPGHIASMSLTNEPQTGTRYVRPDMTDIWSGMERRPMPEPCPRSNRMLNISEVRERSPTMSAELISADSEFPARAGHVVQRRTNVPPSVLPENAFGTKRTTKCNSRRAILGRGVSGTATSSFDGVPLTGYLDGNNSTPASNSNTALSNNDVRVRPAGRCSRALSPAVPTPHPLLQQPVTHVGHNSPLHSVQRRWSSGDCRVEASGHDSASYFATSNMSVSRLPAASLTSNPIACPTGNWLGISRPFAQGTSHPPKAQHYPLRPVSGGHAFLSRWHDGLNGLSVQNNSTTQRACPPLIQRPHELGGQQFSCGGISESIERRGVSVEDARMLYQTALGSRDLIDHTVEPHMLRPLPPELLHKDSVVVIERPDLVDMFKQPPQLSS